jgi:hypothetical protein
MVRPEGQRGLPAWVVVPITAAALVALAAVGGIGYGAWKWFKKEQAAAIAADEPILTSLAAIGPEIEGNRPTALNRYKGRQIEVDVTGVIIRSGDEKGVWLALIGAGSPDSLKKSGLMWKAYFYFDDPRNVAIKNIRGDGPLKVARLNGRVRGTFWDIEDADPLNPDDLAWVILNPAYVEAMNRK